MASQDQAAVLSRYVETWWTAIDEFTKLLETLSPEEWSADTDLAGWDVHAIAAHTAHLEAVLAGAPEETVDVGEPDHVTGLMGLYTEQGVVSRRDKSPDELITEIRSSSTKRHTELLADPPTDPSAHTHPTFGAIGWDTGRLLRNRPLDVWMHEQDVRRAVARPGNLDTAAAQHTADYLVESFGLVVGKRVAPPPGTVAVLEVDGSAPYAVEVGADGRARPLPEIPADPTVRLSMGREAFILIAGGRRWPGQGEVLVTGDQELGARILDTMAVTP
jgi:uncharacterized protein (TIGR03083 family)